jgi:flavorubredoxin
MQDVSDLAWRSNITTDAIRIANQLGRDHEDLGGHARLILPGCREHLIVETPDHAVETPELVARQHGVAIDGLIDANPDRLVDAYDRWTTVQAGDLVLIPAH